MLSRTLAALLIAAATIEVGGLWFLASARAPSTTVSAAGASHDATATADDAPTLSRSTVPTPAIAAPPALGARQTLGDSRPAFSIAGPRGEPVADAELSWTALPEWAFEHDADAGLAARLAAGTTWTRSDRAGRFEFSDVPALARAHASVIWITHPDYLAASVIVDADRARWPSLAHVTLEPAQGVEVEVVDDAGPVAGASVIQSCAAPAQELAHASPSLELVARRAFRRVVTTRSDGWTRLVPIAGAAEVRARHGARASETALVAGVERLTLRLYSTFEVSGRVRGLELAAEPGLRPRIACHAELGVLLRAIDTLDVGADGRFGPVAVPIVAGADYRFVLRGGRLVPRAFLARAPAPGSRVEIELTAEVGHDVWFRIVDEEEQSLPKAEAIVRWTADGVELDARARPRPDGFTVVRGAPSGTIVCEARAPGYRSTQLGAESLPEVEPATRGVMLAPAGRLSGRCTHAGQPVRDFEITVWPASNAFNYVRHAFTDREDGTFALDDAPLGSVCVLAAGATLAPAQVVRVDVHPDNVRHIELELPDPVRGRGRVVAHASGAPLPDARVQLFATDGHDVIASLGSPRPVHADGTFELDGFAAGRMVCAVSAPGCATTRVAVDGARASTIDLGVIALVPKQELEVRLLLEPGRDASEFQVSLTGADSIPPRACPPNGTLRIGELSPGSYEMHVVRDGELVFGAYPLLVAGETWTIDVPLASAHAVAIEVTGDEERARAGALTAVIAFRGAQGEQMERYAAVSPTGRAAFDGVLAGEVSVSVFDAHREILTTVHAKVPATQRELALVIPLSDAQVYRVRVVNSEGQAIPAARVQLARDGAGAAWSEATTDETGECAFRGIEPGRYLAHVFHQTRGKRVGVPVELVARARDAVVLELASDARVEVVFADGDVPQAGVSATLHDARESIAFQVIRSNELGIARADGVAEADYVLAIDEPAYFPVRVKLHSSRDGAPTPVALQRRGDLELSVRTPAGVPLAGVAVQITSADGQHDVAHWWSEGLVQAHERGLVSDESGKLVIVGLPHGPYRWRATGPAGDVEGLVRVAPETVVHAPIVLP